MVYLTMIRMESLGLQSDDGRIRGVGQRYSRSDLKVTLG
jgi:hypothetical protein